MNNVDAGLTDLKVSVARIETSTSELNRRLDNIEVVLRGLQASHEAIGVMTATLNAHERRIASLEDNLKWLTRAVTGAVIAAVLALVLAKTGIGVKL